MSKIPGVEEKAAIRQSNVPQELQSFLDRLPKAILMLAVMKPYAKEIHDLEMEIEQMEERERKQIIEGIRLRILQQLNFAKGLLKVKIETVQSLTELSEHGDFTVSQMVNAMYTFVHRSNVFLRGHLKTNFGGVASKTVGLDDIIPETITKIQCSDGVLIIGLSKEESALSFVTEARFELELDSKKKK